MHIVHTESSLGWGGQEIRIITEAAGMIARGHRVTLLTPSEAPILNAAKSHGVETVALPIEKKTLKGLLSVSRWFAANPTVDIVNTHSSTDSWLIGLAAVFARNFPSVVRTRHISAPVRDSLFNRWLYGHSASRVVTTGEALRRDLVERLQLEENHVLSIATGIDLRRFSRTNTPGRKEARLTLGLPEGSFIVGIAATLRSWKGHDDLLSAFELLARDHADLHLAIAGDGPRREHLERLIAASPWSERIHMLGHRGDVPTVLAALDLFVLPSYANEGVPQAIMQAMAMELPVISTMVGAIADAVLNGQTGVLLPPRDPQQLASAIASLKNDSDTYNAYASAGHKRAGEKFSLERMLDAMTGVFQEARASTRR